MNILIPDSWLRDFLKTNAKPADIARCLSLCGPSIERTEKIGADYMYEVEVTTNRVDTLSVYGVAREAAAILPEFGFSARLVSLPKSTVKQPSLPLDIKITNDPSLCRRILAIKLTNVKLGPSPSWLQKRLELVGQRPLNNIVDITNYIMWETGHPMHAFDYNRLVNKKIIVRLAKKGESFTTLDSKKFTTVGGEIIFDDGTGEIIDLPGIMGTANTVVTGKTHNVLLFIENSHPAKIRFASMTHAIRSQAAVINEKDPDQQLAITAMERGIALALKVTQGRVGSKLMDIYPQKPKSVSVTLSEEKLTKYIGTKVATNRVLRILSALGFVARHKRGQFIVTPPSWRGSDITIPEDVIEEIARIYGYHNIGIKLPDTEPPAVIPDKTFAWEEEIKISLRDWGYTETYTYSMVSKNLALESGLSLEDHLKIQNPLSDDWVYLRRSLIPSLTQVIKDNQQEDVSVFELQNVYHPQGKGKLPQETLHLTLITSKSYRELKGTIEALHDKLFIEEVSFDPVKNLPAQAGPPKTFVPEKTAAIRSGATLLGYVGLTRTPHLFGCELYVKPLLKAASTHPRYIPVVTTPPIIEDYTFKLPAKTPVGHVIDDILATSKLIEKVSLKAIFKQNYTFTVSFRDPQKSLSDKAIAPIRQKIVVNLAKHFSAKLLGKL